MYTVINFKSKKALKDAIKAAQRVEIFNPGPFGDAPQNGRVSLEGPHFPEPHRWYASAQVVNGAVVKVS